MSCRFGGIPVKPSRRSDGILPKVLRGQTVWLSLRYGRVHQHQSKDSLPQGPRRPPLVLQEQQVSPQTNALQNDRITRQKKNKDVHWPVLASLLHNCNLLVHRNRCRKGRDQVEGGYIQWLAWLWLFPNYFVPPVNHPNLCLRRIRWLNTDSSNRWIHTDNLQFSSGAEEAHQYPKHLRH